MLGCPRALRLLATAALCATNQCLGSDEFNMAGGGRNFEETQIFLMFFIIGFQIHKRFPGWFLHQANPLKDRIKSIKSITYKRCKRVHWSSPVASWLFHCFLMFFFRSSEADYPKCLFYSARAESLIIKWSFFPILAMIVFCWYFPMPVAVHMLAHGCSIHWIGIIKAWLIGFSPLGYHRYHYSHGGFPDPTRHRHGPLRSPGPVQLLPGGRYDQMDPKNPMGSRWFTHHGGQNITKPVILRFVFWIFVHATIPLFQCCWRYQ